MVKQSEPAQKEPNWEEIDAHIEAQMDENIWCEHCHNTGELDCYCGGDLCVCTRYGTYPCPYCSPAP